MRNITNTKKFQCMMCGYIIEVPYGMPKPMRCPRCGAPAQFIHRIDKGPRWGRGRGACWGWRQRGPQPQ